MNAEYIKGLDELINDAVKEGVFPGCNIALVTDKDKYFATYGNKALIPSVEKNDIDTLYDMASCSKVLSTTTCIFKLLEKGALRLYDSVKKYLPRFLYDDITIWDLMTHSSGLPSSVTNGSKITSYEEAIDFIYKTEVSYEKNTKIVYSDVGYILLGFVVEKITGKSLDKASKVLVFDPLEMYDTCYNPSDKMRCAPTEERDDIVCHGIVRGKVHDERAYWLNGVAGHAGLFSTVKDISHFIEMVLNNGVYKGKQFLSQATIDLMFTPQVRIPNGVSLDYNQRGLGWIVKGDFCSAGDLASPETILHTGFTGTNVFIDRINRVGFTMLSNRVHPTRNNVLVIPFRGRLGNYIISHFGGRNCDL